MGLTPYLIRYRTDLLERGLYKTWVLDGQGNNSQNVWQEHVNVTCEDRLKAGAQSGSHIASVISRGQPETTLAERVPTPRLDPHGFEELEARVSSS